MQPEWRPTPRKGIVGCADVLRGAVGVKAVQASRGVSCRRPAPQQQNWEPRVRELGGHTSLGCPTPPTPALLEKHPTLALLWWPPGSGFRTPCLRHGGSHQSFFISSQWLSFSGSHISSPPGEDPTGSVICHLTCSNMRSSIRSLEVPLQSVIQTGNSFEKDKGS